MLVGRSRKCELRLAHGSVSGEHAVIWWHDGRWWLRDLGSRNGTTLDEAAVGRDGTILEVGRTVQFGTHPLSWIVESTSEPSPMAVPVSGTGELVVAADGLLALPPGDEPEAVIYEAEPGWILEHADQIRPVHDLEIVELAGGSWRVHLPQVVSPTVNANGEGPLEFESIGLSFRVSSDEEHVAVAVEAEARRVDLGTRAHHYMLLTLARAWLADADHDPATRGWVYQDDLCRQLQIERERLNVLVFRARKQLASSGIRDARELVQRRPDSAQLRIGVSRLDIVEGV